MARDQRIGHAERTQVLALLGNAYEAGLLPVGDYDARVVAVGSATYASELTSQLSGLPPDYAWDTATPPAPAAASSPATAPGRATAPGPASDPGPAAISGTEPAAASGRMPVERRAAGRIALILGIASVPLSFCVIGGILGVLAVISSRGAGPGVTPALIGRIFGIVGIALSVTALFAFFYFRNASLGP